MPLILAIERDRHQAARLAALAKVWPDVELCQARAAADGIRAIGDRIPDLVLTSPLISSRDDALLAEHLRALGAAGSHVQTLRIPILGGAIPGSGGLLGRLRRGRAAEAPADGCDPDVFAKEIAEYLERARSERAAAAAMPAIERQPIEVAAPAADGPALVAEAVEPIVVAEAVEPIVVADPVEPLVVADAVEPVAMADAVEPVAMAEADSGEPWSGQPVHAAAPQTVLVVPDEPYSPAGVVELPEAGSAWQAQAGEPATGWSDHDAPPVEAAASVSDATRVDTRMAAAAAAERILALQSEVLNGASGPTMPLEAPPAAPTPIVLDDGPDAETHAVVALADGGWAPTYGAPAGGEAWSEAAGPVAVPADLLTPEDPVRALDRPATASLEDDVLVFDASAFLADDDLPAEAQAPRPEASAPRAAAGTRVNGADAPGAGFRSRSSYDSAVRIANGNSHTGAQGSTNGHAHGHTNGHANGGTAQPPVAEAAPAAVQDEWGIFDPAQCGFAALADALEEAARRAGVQTSDAEAAVPVPASPRRTPAAREHTRA